MLSQTNITADEVNYMANAKKLGKARGRLAAMQENLQYQMMQQNRQDRLNAAEQAHRERLEEREYARKQAEQNRQEQNAFRMAQLQMQAARLVNMGTGKSSAGNSGSKSGGNSGSGTPAADLNRAKAYNQEVTPESVNAVAEELYGKNAFSPEEIQGMTAAFKQQVISNPENPVSMEAFIGRKARQKGLTSVYDLSGYRKAHLSDTQTGNTGDSWLTPWKNGEMRTYRQNHSGIYDSQKVLYDRLSKGLADLTYTSNDEAFFSNPELVRAFSRYYNAGNSEANSAAMASVEAYARANNLDPKQLMDNLKKPGAFKNFQNNAMQYGLTRASQLLAAPPAQNQQNARNQPAAQNQNAQSTSPSMANAFDPEKFRRNLETVQQVRQRIQDLQTKRKRVESDNPPDMHTSTFNEENRIARIRKEQNRIDKEIQKAEGWLKRHTQIPKNNAPTVRASTAHAQNYASAPQPAVMETASRTQTQLPSRKIPKNFINGIPAEQAIARKKQDVANDIRKHRMEDAKAATDKFTHDLMNRTPGLSRWTNPQFRDFEQAAGQDVQREQERIAAQKRQEEDRAFEKRIPVNQYTPLGGFLAEVGDDEFRNMQKEREQWEREMLESGQDPAAVNKELKRSHYDALVSGKHLPPIRNLLSDEDYNRFRSAFDAKENRLRSILAKPYEDWTPQERDEMNDFQRRQRNIQPVGLPETPQARLRNARTDAGAALEYYGPERVNSFRKSYPLLRPGTSLEPEKEWTADKETGFLNWLKRNHSEEFNERNPMPQPPRLKRWYEHFGF